MTTSGNGSKDTKRFILQKVHISAISNGSVLIFNNHIAPVVMIFMGKSEADFLQRNRRRKSAEKQRKCYAP